MPELEVNLRKKKFTLFLTKNEKINESIIGGWGSKHCNSFVSTESSGWLYQCQKLEIKISSTLKLFII